MSADTRLTMGEAMRRTGLGYSTIRGYIASGKLRAWRVGRQLRVSQADVDKLFVPVDNQTA